MSIRTACAAGALGFVLGAFAATTTASAHPGAGIVVDGRGRVFFVDTGAGVWKAAGEGRLERHPGPAFHWMAIDRKGGFAGRDSRRGPAGDLPVVGPDPTLVLSSDFPVAIGPDGALYHPRAEGDRVKIMRRLPGGESTAFATLPPVMEVGEDGKARAVPWMHGLAAAPDGSLYYAERDAVRKVSPEGVVSLVAGGVVVPGCERPPGAADERLGPDLRGLDVAADGTIYVAASACSALLKIAPDGAVSVALRASDAWTPTGVAVAGGDVYVLEYRLIKAERREDWLPRVRKLAPDGSATVIAAVEHR